MSTDEKKRLRAERRARRKQRIARAGRIGRKVALSVYWAGLVYMFIVGFATVIPQAFFPDVPESPRTAELSCDEALSNLRSSLVAAGRERMPPPPPQVTVEPFGLFLQSWDAQLIGIRERCGDAPGYDDLERFRYRYETTVRRFARTDGVLIQRVDTALGSQRNQP
ncbi:MAG: hypothetical protein AAF411_30640 [Myxococcota bacterium]